MLLFSFSCTFSTSSKTDSRAVTHVCKGHWTTSVPMDYWGCVFPHSRSSRSSAVRKGENWLGFVLSDILENTFHSDRCAVVSQCDSNLYFLKGWNVSIFSCGHLSSFSAEGSLQSCSPAFNCFFLPLKFWVSSYILDILGIRSSSDSWLSRSLKRWEFLLLTSWQVNLPQSAGSGSPGAQRQRAGAHSFGLPPGSWFPDGTGAAQEARGVLCTQWSGIF